MGFLVWLEVKPQHRRAFQSKNDLGAAPVLEFVSLALGNAHSATSVRVLRNERSRTRREQLIHARRPCDDALL